MVPDWNDGEEELGELGEEDLGDADCARAAAAAAEELSPAAS